MPAKYDQCNIVRGSHFSPLQCILSDTTGGRAFPNQISALPITILITINPNITI